MSVNALSSIEAIHAEALTKVFSSLAVPKRVTPGQAWRMAAAVAGFEPRTANHARGVKLHIHRREHAIRDVSFAIRAGQGVAITGPGESGKSVLLRILSGALKPSGGRVVLSGSIAALLDRKGSLKPLESAIENTRYAAKLAGVRQKDRRSFGLEVIEFAGLDGFEDVPVANYSTGMRMRLAAAMTLRTGADILLIDDVLRVGDIAFQQRCRAEIGAARRRGATVLFVTADDELIAQAADRQLAFNEGELAEDRLLNDARNRPVLTGHVTQGWTWAVTSMLARCEVAEFLAFSLEPSPRGVPMLRMETRVLAPGCTVRPLIDIVRDNERAVRSLYPRFEPVGNGERRVFEVDLPGEMLRARCAISPALVVLRAGEVFSMKNPSAVTLDPGVRPTPGIDRCFDQPEQCDAEAALDWVVEGVAS